MTRAQSRRSKRKTRSLNFLPAFEKIRELRNQPDQVAAIVAGTILEGALEKRLAGRMRRMSAKDHNELFHSGPLRNFQPKIILGQALSLYGPETVVEMRKIAEIRNAFAHTVRDITFESSEIKKWCLELKRCNLRAPPFFAAILSEKSICDSPFDGIRSSAKLRFLYSVMILVYMLESNPDDRPARARAPWPGFYG